jgi:hypothetical protein
VVTVTIAHQNASPILVILASVLGDSATYSAMARKVTTVPEKMRR